MNITRFSFLGTLFVALTLLAFPTCAETEHLYLVMAGDGSTTMTVQFQTTQAVESGVDYGKIEPPSGGAYESHATGTSKQIPGLEDGRHIHAVELTGLSPATTYFFKTASGKVGKFRTLPNDGSPIRGAFGGDMSVFPSEAQLLKVAAKEGPDVAVLGGDIAYADNDIKQIKLWDMWLDRWEKLMVREDGTMIPMIMAIGNHEVHGNDNDPPEQRALAYFGFFAQGGKTSFTRDLGPNARLIALDSGHIVTHESQVPFLRASLEGAQDKPFVFATYHVPLFPSHREFDGALSVEGRKQWQPLFDEFDLSIGFEHHDHTYKRTKPIRGTEVNPEGTTYLGDGCFGQAPRDITNGSAWFMEKAEKRAHVWIVDIAKDNLRCRAIDQLGQTFDDVNIGPRNLAAVR